ncbi:hypothetical protein FIV41_33505 [Pseudomonas marginalis]|uniref:Uncharacterized protein n=1 Tax=Pseudomonas marginalis TaxID=298 RepID=A0A9X9FU37_PSEMA|nr:hypothetical protein FIV41_33505 [Pseudomonas marginalis]
MQTVTCGERACPALGCEAAPIRSPQSARINRGEGFGAAAQPNAGQARSPQLQCSSLTDWH